jgi:hypothetical protein
VTTAAAIAIAAPIGLLVGLGASSASADTKPRNTLPVTDSTDALPTWQIDGVVWDTVAVGNTVYATGRFTKARPPGTAVDSAASVSRTNLLAFDIRTGVVTSFNHTLNAQGLRLAVTPGGATLYVGGDFTKVDGVTHRHLAAFNTATGALITGFKPVPNARVRAIAATSTQVFIGGDFTTVGNAPRERLAAVSSKTGGVLKAWAPKADKGVYAMGVAAGNRIIVGGKFQKINGNTKIGITAISAKTGKNVAWASHPIPTTKGTNYSYVTDLVVSGKTVYGTADGEGSHWYDGKFAATASTGKLVWLDNCYGATYSGFVRGKVFYTVGHAHDCASLGTFPETSPRTYHRSLAETTYATGKDKSTPGAGSHYSKQPIPSQLHWYPSINLGTFTGQNQGAWAITGNSKYTALGGEFTRVNGVDQQGLVRFTNSTLAPNKSGPVPAATLTPTLTSPVPGAVHVSWTRTWDQDNEWLDYVISRDGVVVATIPARSEFWWLKVTTFDDTGLTSGSSHVYKVQARDPFGNVMQGVAAPAIIVS